MDMSVILKLFISSVKVASGFTGVNFGLSSPGKYGIFLSVTIE